MNKRHLIIFSSCLLFLFTLCFADTTGLDKVKEIISNIQDAILKIGGGLCLIMLIIGGAISMTAREDAKQMSKGIATVKYALFGLIIILAAVVLLNFVSGLGN
jgi:TRAP-type mannitol/chloroaromatic compound transport system permease small subunit